MSHSDSVTVRVPKTFLTYLLGLLIGAFLGAGIVLTATHAFRSAVALILLGCMLAIIFGLLAWAVGEPR